MKNIAYLISGSGRNFEKLLQFSLEYSISIPKILIFREASPTYKRFKKYDIPRFIIKNDFLKNRDWACNEILAYCNSNSIDYILMGFDRLLSGDLLVKYNKKIVNIHPSYLPKFKGLNAVYEQYHSDEKFWGCTSHFIDHKMDEGEIIYQDKILINKKLNFNDSQKDLFKLMCKVSLFTLIILSGSNLKKEKISKFLKKHNI